MGYRLHAIIPNVVYEDNSLELGKQYDQKWNRLNDYYLCKECNSGLIHPHQFDDFLDLLNEINIEVETYKLYNIDLLEKMMEYAKENDYSIYFYSV